MTLSHSHLQLPLKKNYKKFFTFLKIGKILDLNFNWYWFIFGFGFFSSAGDRYDGESNILQGSFEHTQPHTHKHFLFRTEFFLNSSIRWRITSSVASVSVMANRSCCSVYVAQISRAVCAWRRLELCCAKMISWPKKIRKGANQKVMTFVHAGLLIQFNFFAIRNSAKSGILKMVQCSCVKSSTPDFLFMF